MKNQERLPFAKAFWDLVVHQRCRELQGEVFQFTKSLPRDEERSLKDQIRRSSRSIGAQIAEARGKRDYQKHFISKLSDAQSENLETQPSLITAVDDGYLDQAAGHELFGKSLEIGRMLHTMSERASEFCSDGTKVTETSPIWFTTDHRAFPDKHDRLNTEN